MELNGELHAPTTLPEGKPIVHYMASHMLNVKLSPCFNWAPHNEGVLGEWRYSSTHSSSRTRWRWVV